MRLRQQRITRTPQTNGYQAKSSIYLNAIYSQLESPPIDGGTEGSGISSGQQTVGEGGHLAQGRVGGTGTTAGHVELYFVALPIAH